MSTPSARPTGGPARGTTVSYGASSSIGDAGRSSPSPPKGKAPEDAERATPKARVFRETQVLTVTEFTALHSARHDARGLGLESTRRRGFAQTGKGLPLGPDEGILPLWLGCDLEQSDPIDSGQPPHGPTTLAGGVPVGYTWPFCRIHPTAGGSAGRVDATAGGPWRLAPRSFTAAYPSGLRGRIANPLPWVRIPPPPVPA